MGGRALRVAPAVLLAGLACAVAAGGPEPPGPPVTAVAPGVYAVLGDPGEPAPTNDGRVANTGFVVGRDGVVVIDTGPHVRHGEWLLAAVAAVTPLPVVLAINTQARAESVLGNGAFARRGVPILAHANAAAAMAGHCDACLRTLRETLGPERMAGTEPAAPGRTVTRTTAIEAGGRRLRLLHYGHAQSAGDLAVLDVETGVLFAGGLVSLERVPVLQFADTRGWVHALERLAREPLTRIVPGNGPVADPSRLAETAAYLRELRAAVERARGRGAALTEAAAACDLPAWRGWALYRQRHAQNAQHVYYELEKEDLSR
jgi:glyoxylase-like metal-dependent hydrolase (beta-lactamase superfamily II)